MEIIEPLGYDVINANMMHMFKQNVFIITRYVKTLKIKLDIPIDIQLLILLHIGSTIICECHIYLFYITLKNQQYQHAQLTLSNIRKHILLYGCVQSEDHGIIDHQEIDTNLSTNQYYQVEYYHSLVARRNNTNLSLTRQNEDTTRGKAWRLLLGLKHLDSNNYQTQIRKGESKDSYAKIRGDTKRTFLISDAYTARVSLPRINRLLNSFVQQHPTRYCSGWDAIAGVLLYVMPELPAFESFCALINTHFPLYFYSDQSRKNGFVGSYAASFLAWDILQACDKEIFDHLIQLPAHTYLFPVVVSIQTISQPFTEVIKLWDFLCCFGFHLNPVMAAAHIIVNKKELLLPNPVTLLQGLLSQRKWMNRSTDSREIINCTMRLIEMLKEPQHKTLWNNVLYHATNMDVATSIKIDHENIHFTEFTPSNPSTDNEQVNVVIDKEMDAQELNEDADEDNNAHNNLEIVHTEQDITDNDSTQSTDLTNDEDQDDDGVDEQSDSSSRWSMSSTHSSENDQQSDSTSNPVAERRVYCRWVQLNEFELNNEQIELFNTYETEHNQLLSEQHTNFIQSQNQCIAMDCVDEDLLQYWKSFMSSHSTS
eukprot:819479_1